MWWEGVGACAPIGSPLFKLVGAINNRISQFADPLFLLQRLPARQATPGNVDSSEATARFAIQTIWTTAEGIYWPATRGVNGTMVAARAPGAAGRTDLIQKMSSNVVAVHLTNVTNAAAGQNEDYIFFLSTVLSTNKGAEATRARPIEITMRDDVATIHPVEPDAFQGQPADCTLNLLGSKGILMLPGGGLQLLSFTILSPPAPPPLLKTGGSDGVCSENERVASIGRRPLRPQPRRHAP